MFKRLISLVILLFMFTALSAAYGESQSIDSNTNTESETEDEIIIEPETLNSLGFTAEAWMDSDEMRTYFTVCMITDCISVLSDDDMLVIAEALALNTVYVGADNASNIITEIFFGQNKMFTFMYSTNNGECTYLVDDLENATTLAPIFMAAMVSSDICEEYYEIDNSAVVQLIEAVTE